ncbi:MAG: helix-hairpin-helix domain-containing protein [Oscillospiraceae bacterium]|nr:helix-hairpin-helix domain-containing protein [Oscillospiraceae bacterium]
MKRIKENLAFLITMTVFVSACAVIMVFTVLNEPQYVRVISGDENVLMNESDTTEKMGELEDETEEIVTDVNDTELPLQPTSININTATLDELQRLPRIGPAIALRIVEYRELHGGFLYLEEIMQVSGIGEATFENIQNYIYIEGE